MDRRGILLKVLGGDRNVSPSLLLHMCVGTPMHKSVPMRLSVCIETFLEATGKQLKKNRMGAGSQGCRTSNWYWNSGKGLQLGFKWGF